MSLPDFYAILDVPVDATEKDVRDAYRALIRTHHPDRVGPSGDQKAAEQKTAELNHAYDILSDPAERRSYDRDRKPAGPKPTSTAQRPAAQSSTATSADDWDVVQIPKATKAAWRQRAIGISSLLFVPLFGLTYLTSITSGLAIYLFAELLALIFGRNKLLYALTGAGFVLSVDVFGLVGGAAPTWGLLSSSLTAVSILATGLLRTNLRRYRQRYEGAAQLANLEQVAKDFGTEVYIVHGVDGNNALVESLRGQKQSTIYVWGRPDIGDLIVVNAAGNVIKKAPISVVHDAMYVLKDAGRL